MPNTILLSSKTGESSNSNNINQRRSFLRHIGIGAATLATVSTTVRASDITASPKNSGSFNKASEPLLDNKVVITKARLNELAALQHAIFNENNILKKFDATKQGAKYDVELHRITTYTTLPGSGQKAKVSGLLAIPVGVKGPLPVVSWQHGTILSYEQVPSNLTKVSDPNYVMQENVDSAETLLNVQRLAGNGYAIIAADYIGKGPYRDGRSEAYAVKDTTVQTCIDILDAGLTGLQQLGHQSSALFLNGWSQGALNTQWLTQELQSRGKKITATSVESPFNDLNESFQFWAGVETFPSTNSTPYPPMPDWISLCMIIALGSHQDRYGLKDLLRNAVKPEYQNLAVKYWSDYKMDFDKSKPFPSGSNLLIDGFFEKYTNDTNSTFLQLIANNRVTYWEYTSPIRFYYGLADQAIHPVMAKRPLPAGGKFTKGIPVKDGSHRGTFLASLYGEGSEIDNSSNLLDWYNTLK